MIVNTPILVWHLSMLDHLGDQVDVGFFSTREKSHEEEIKLRDEMNFTLLKTTCWEVDGNPLKTDCKEEEGGYGDFYYYIVSLNTRVITQKGYGKLSRDLLLVTNDMNKAITFTNQQANRFYGRDWSVFKGKHYYLAQNQIDSTNPLFPVISMSQTFIDASLAERLVKYSYAPIQK